ncbi:MBL fold metallo-hydrolase RNA specificity domain-containing protein [Ramlibacter sp. AN1015]|uniref:MBL fold metallo-hydrolase RNA specificity domain-containing protein n=1 Tax=Ramlibacter sp. AN1015 TaxID=3133428 RepID=UPI004040AED0
MLCAASSAWLDRASKRPRPYPGTPWTSPFSVQHAAEIEAWLRQMSAKPQRTFVTHGEPAAADALRQRLQEHLGWSAVVPEMGQRYTLTAS